MDEDQPILSEAAIGIDRLSVDELRARITQLRAEIAACEAELARKEAHKSAADSLFGGDG